VKKKHFWFFYREKRRSRREHQKVHKTFADEIASYFHGDQILKKQKNLN